VNIFLKARLKRAFIVLKQMPQAVYVEYGKRLSAPREKGLFLLKYKDLLSLKK